MLATFLRIHELLLSLQRLLLHDLHFLKLFVFFVKFSILILLLTTLFLLSNVPEELKYKIDHQDQYYGAAENDEEYRRPSFSVGTVFLCHLAVLLLLALWFGGIFGVRAVDGSCIGRVSIPIKLSKMRKCSFDLANKPTKL